MFDSHGSVSCTKTSNKISETCFISYHILIYLLIHHNILSPISLFTTGALTKSQFPVFTIYAQKLCFSMRPCDRPWCADRALGNKLNGYVKRSAQAVSRHDCFEMCLGETDFLCR